MKQEVPYQKAVIKIKTLTPVHIRSGNILFRDQDFYVDGKNIHRINYLSFLAAIPPGERSEILRQIKEKGMSSLNFRPAARKPKRPQVEEDWKQALRARAGIVTEEKKDTKEKEVEAGGTNKGEFVDRARIYSCPNHSRAHDPVNKIYGFALDGLLRAYLSGSSIKGMLRTAFYLHALSQQPQRLERMRFTWTNHPLEADYPLQREMAGFDIHDVKRDIFSQLLVRDTNYKSSHSSMATYPVRILNIYQQEDGNKVMGWKNIAKNLDVQQWEMIKQDVEFSSEIIFDRQIQEELAQKMSDFHQIPLVLNVQSMIESLHKFSSWIIDRELEFARTYSIDFLQSFYEGLKKKSESGIYLPVGSGMPWHTKTVGGVLAKENLDGIRRHFYRYMGKFIHMPYGVHFHGMMVKKGRCPKTGRLLKPEKLECVEPFPKTRHIVFQEGRPFCPPGWIELTVTS